MITASERALLLKEIELLFAEKVMTGQIAGLYWPMLPPVAAGDWTAIEKHCRCDVQTTLALARRMRLVPVAVEHADLLFGAQSGLQWCNPGGNVIGLGGLC